MKTTITVTKEEDKNLPTFDYTKLTALNMCPRWGLIRYDQHKRMPGNSRSMALEAGSASHKAYAAIRFLELMNHYGIDKHYSAVMAAGERQFKEHWSGMYDIIHSEESLESRARAVALYALSSSGFYDDPRDRRRTLSNIENSLLSYISRLELGTRIPVVGGDLVGIEVPFDLTIEFGADDVEDWTLPLEEYGDEHGKLALRYIGKMDALVQCPDGTIEVEENKTAARLDDSWMNSFLTSHQVTGYCVAASTLLGQQIDNAVIRGMMIPLPKSYDLGGIVNVPVQRSPLRVREWYLWIWSTFVNQYLPYYKVPLSAPEFTHSCNRYFQSCSFIPLCGLDSSEDRLLTFNQMEHDEWNPLKED